MDVLNLRYPEYVHLAMSNRLYGPEIRDTLEVKEMDKKSMECVYVKQENVGKHFGECLHLFWREHMWCF